MQLMMEVADEFVDNVILAACRMARLRDDSQLSIADLQHVLERNYNIRIPGYSSDDVRVVRKVNPAPAWSQKMNAINAAKVMGGKPDT
jgi:transcription initiation factor TFIID subunit TAF12